MQVIEDLASRIDHQPNATVSKVIASEAHLRLVLFAFDAGEELTEHTASVPAVLQTVEGSVAVGASGEDHTLAVGDWLALEASEPHSVVADGQAKLLLTMFRGC